MKTVGERLVEGLEARGVEVVFGIPGVHTVELYRGLSGSSIRHVTARHEQGCAFMADGYARVLGKPGVAFVITGPGLLNALTAMGQAAADSVPVLVISGVNRRSTLGKGLGMLHELPDQSAMVRPLCPTRQITSPDEVDEVLDWAFSHLTLGRPGPVHIEVPTDVMPLPCSPLAQPQGMKEPAFPTPDQIKQAADTLNAAQRIVILAGGGARGHDHDLRILAERLDAPVVQTVNARGMMHGHPLTVAASPSLDAVRSLISDADQILAIGTEFGPTDYDMYVRGNFPDTSGMIRIDISAEQLKRHQAALMLQGRSGSVLNALLPLLVSHEGNGQGRAEKCRLAARAELADLDPLMPHRLAMVETIQSALPNAILVGDSTQPIYAANLYYDHDRAGGFFNAATGFGALGFSTGAAVGAALAAPDAKVVCLLGDGGLQFSPGELRSAVDENLPITFLVWNNAAFNEIAEAMRGANTEIIGCAPTPLKLEYFAAACDLPFESVANNQDALHQALSRPQTGPRLIEVRVPL